MEKPGGDGHGCGGERANKRLVLTWVLFDLTAPLVAIDSISPVEARSGSEVTVAVTVTESGSGLGVGAVTASLGGQGHGGLGAHG